MFSKVLDETDGNQPGSHDKILQQYEIADTKFVKFCKMYNSL